MEQTQGLFSRYEAVVILDTETSGLRYDLDEIIELAAVRLSLVDGEVALTQEYDELIALSPGRRLNPRITQLTGISEEDLKEFGIEKKRACEDFARLIEGKRVLVAAYNAHFDLSFLYYLLSAHQMQSCLRPPDFLDILTVYKDRRDYPHKLKDAICAYDLQDQVVNSHRALDDVKATVEVLRKMEQERNDLCQYINLFGYNPKYGVEGKRIGSVCYRPQSYLRLQPLYECGQALAR